MTDSLDHAFAAGTLLHPLEGKANSVHLFRTLAQLAGAQRLPSSPQQEYLRSLIGHHDHYLFVLVDGLGMNLRELFPPGGFLARSLKTDIRACFPSTTAVALTALATGMWPGGHGLAGWWTCFPEHRRVIAPLPFEERGTRTSAADLGLNVEDLIPVPPIMGGFFRNTGSFIPHFVTGTHYETWSRGGTQVWPYKSFGQLRRRVLRGFRQLTGPSYRYIYMLTVDALCHRHGTESEEVAREVARTDRLLAALRDGLSERVRMVVSADHGLVNVPPERFFTFRSADALAAHTLGGQSGEGRTPVFHLRPGHEAAFLDEFARTGAAQHFTLYKPAELARRGLYGPEPLSDEAKAHLGDYVGISSTAARFEFVPDGSEPVRHVGVHGGLLPGEMAVPLCIA
jgi:hypothetical protein